MVNASGDRGVVLAPCGDNSAVDGRGGESTVDDGTLTFAAPPAAAELGTRAARIYTKDGNPATDPDAGRAVVAYLPLRGAAALDIAFKMEVYATGTGMYRTLVYEPCQNGSDVIGQWIEHDVLGGQIWSSNIANSNPCSQAVTCSIADYLTLNPNARVLSAKFVIGQNPGQGWPGFIGWLDDARLGFNGQTARYDFGG